MNAVGNLPRAIKVPADTDVVPASDIDHVHDVVHDCLEIRRSRVVRVEEPPHKHDHQHAAIVLEPRNHIVRCIAVVLGQCVARRVAKDDRRPRRVQHVAHRLVRDVRQVDEHAQTVHLADPCDPKLGQPSILAPSGDRRGGRGIRVVAVVRDGDVPHPQVVQLAEHGDRGACLVETLCAQHRRDLARLEGLAHAGWGGAEFKFREVVDEAARDVDLLQGVSHGVSGVIEAFEVVALDKNGPELAADSTFL